MQPNQQQSRCKKAVDKKILSTTCLQLVYTLFALLSHLASGRKHASGERVAWVFWQVPLLGALRGMLRAAHQSAVIWVLCFLAHRARMLDCNRVCGFSDRRFLLHPASG